MKKQKKINTPMAQMIIWALLGHFLMLPSSFSIAA